MIGIHVEDEVLDPLDCWISHLMDRIRYDEEYTYWTKFGTIDLSVTWNPPVTRLRTMCSLIAKETF